MSVNKCPLCGSRVINGSCPECGYNIPDEASIAAPYNYDPSDYNINEEKYRPAEEEKSSMPEIRVYDNGGAPIKREERVNPYANFNPAQNGGTNAAPKQNVNPYANSGPAKNNGANAAPPQNVNPYANFDPAANQGGKYNSNGTGKMSGQAVTSLVIGIIATLIWPVFGIFYIIAMVKNYNKTKDESYKTALWVLIAVVVFRFIIGGFTG